ncbi:MAG TPA: hypothetical protein ENF16_02440, partial [Bacteroidetes bacterium]|nr:hypothetical protein [Bacteroidota bacterium]
MSASKTPERQRHGPAAKTLRQGSYRLVDGAENAVTVRSSAWRNRDVSDFNHTDLMLFLLDSCWEKAEQSYYQGLDEGYNMGYAEGLRRGRADAEKSGAAFQQALDTLEKSLLQFYAGVERWTVKLAMRIAEKVVGNAAQEQQEIVHQTVRKAIAETADKTRILIKVNPSDFEALKDFRTDVTALSEGIEHFRIETDAGITPGSCKVETPSGLVDA